MEQQAPTSLSRLIRERKAQLGTIDQELLQEIARQKMLDQLVGDMSSNGSRSEQNSSRRSNQLQDSGISQLSSIRTEQIVDELQKLKMLSQYYKKAHNLPIDRTKTSVQDETVPSFTRTHKKLYPKEYSIQKQQKQKTEEIELQELTEEELSKHFQHYRKTISKHEQKQQHIYKLATIKQQWRQATLAQERQLIRQQLINQQKLKHQQEEKKGPACSFKAHQYVSNYLAQPILFDNPTLKLQRQCKFKTILNEVSRAHRKADRLKESIRDSSFLR